MTLKETAVITGITGQDGSYLAELLLEKGYEVYGMVRRSSTETFERIEHIIKDIHLFQGDLLDQVSLINLIKIVIEEAEKEIRNIQLAKSANFFSKLFNNKKYKYI